MAGAGQPIIIKKKKFVVAAGHHGGAWKVAYADFVTAMMAFFLLMWLLNATTEDQRKGLADYFNPSIPVSRISGGGSGALNGSSVFSDDNLIREGAGASESLVAPSLREDGVVEREENEETKEDRAAREALEKIEDSIEKGRDALEKVNLAEHIQTRMTPDGLIVELIDSDDMPLFNVGSARPSPLLDQLLEVIAPILATAANRMQVIGHTDARPYPGEGDYTNWELSAERAAIARRRLVAHGLPAEQIAGVIGKADTEPAASDPFATQNRRIAVLLLSENRKPAERR